MTPRRGAASCAGAGQAIQTPTTMSTATSTKPMIEAQGRSMSPVFTLAKKLPMA